MTPRYFNPVEFGNILPKEIAAIMTARGYRRVSNRYRIIARVDRPDWIPLATNMHGYFMGTDHYRRCLSQDCIEGVPDRIYKLIPASNHDDVGFVDLSTKEASK